VTARSWIGFKESRQLLASYGIPLPGQLSEGLDDVLRVADETGYPVVLKAVSSQIVHKSDIDAVFLNLKDRNAVERAYLEISDNLDYAGVGKPDGVLVQAMAAPGFELLVGAKQDASFGPVTMLGHGGRYVELFADVTTGIGVLEREDVLRMLSNTMAGKVIDGFRGPPLDKEAVIDLTIRISRLMAEHPEIHELDLNPAIVYESGLTIVDSRLLKGNPVVYPRHTDLSPEKMASLNRILNPDSVAVVGASRPGTMGGIILKNCMRVKRLYPIHPHLKAVQGLPCYRTLSELPEAPDVAVFAINSEATVQCFEELCRIGGKGAIIFSDGFAEVGRNDLEDRLVSLSREYNVAYSGPNCMGGVDNFSGLNTLFLPEQRTGLITEPGGIGIISQSGGVAVELVEMLAADNLPLGKMVSCGNSSSVSVPAILAHMGEDLRIKVIAIYLEGLADGLKLMEIGRQVTQKKPVLIIKGGSGGGAAATLSHTASLAGNYEAFRACCRQARFYLVEELKEDPKMLVNILSILTTQPPACGNRVAVVSVGGGAGILLADQITAEGMQLAEFSPTTRESLRELIRGNSRVAKPENREKALQGIAVNPVDLLGNCDDDRLLEALRIADKDPNTDIVLAAIYLQVPYLSEYLPEKIADLRNELTKPLIVSPRGFSEYVTRCRGFLYSKDFHTYTVPMIKPMSVAIRIWKDYGISFQGVPLHNS